MKLKSEIIEVQSNMALLKQRMLTRNWKKKGKKNVRGDDNDIYIFSLVIFFN